MLAPGQMKTQKEAVALRLQIDELKKMQQEQRDKVRRDEMTREGIPIERAGSRDQVFIRHQLD